MNYFRLFLLAMLVNTLNLHCSSSDDNPANNQDAAVSLDFHAGDLPADSGMPREKVEVFIPESNEISGWSEDLEDGFPGIQKAYSNEEISKIIGEEQKPYAALGCRGFAQQNYTKGDNHLLLRIWEMETTQAAGQIYEENKSELGNQLGQAPTEVPQVGAGYAIGEASTELIAVASFEHYHLQIKASANLIDEMPALRGESQGFAEHIFARMKELLHLN